MSYKRLLFLLAVALARAQGDNRTPTLDPDAIQSGSFTDGSGSLGVDAAQVPSLTSENNFINFCAGKTLTNGLQITEGSCNGIVMGEIPSVDRMISVVITNPQNGDSIKSNEDFNITVQVSNLEAGAFTNAVATYYAAPQQLKSGKVVGHLHVTVQDTGNSLNPKEPLDPTQFAFFKGINDAGDGKGGLSAAVTGGLPAGNYRLCTLTSAANHQPVIMPVAQRGSQDDCVRFTVTGNGDIVNPAANNGEKGKASAALAAEAVALGPGAPDPGNRGGGNSNKGNSNGGGNNKGNNTGNNGANNNNGDGDGGSNNNENEENSGNNRGGKGKATASAAAQATKTTPTGSEASETVPAASGQVPAETPRAGKGKGGAERLRRLSRRRQFVA
ncbi:hypothetical protein VTI74DRAFT_7360 [Chaetomium olivicolor]